MLDRDITFFRRKSAIENSATCVCHIISARREEKNNVIIIINIIVIIIDCVVVPVCTRFLDCYQFILLVSVKESEDSLRTSRRSTISHISARDFGVHRGNNSEINLISSRRGSVVRYTCWIRPIQSSLGIDFTKGPAFFLALSSCLLDETLSSFSYSPVDDPPKLLTFPSITRVCDSFATNIKKSCEKDQTLYFSERIHTDLYSIDRSVYIYVYVDRDNKGSHPITIVGITGDLSLGSSRPRKKRSNPCRNACPAVVRPFARIPCGPSMSPLFLDLAGRIQIRSFRIGCLPPIPGGILAGDQRKREKREGSLRITRKRSRDPRVVLSPRGRSREV